MDTLMNGFQAAVNQDHSLRRSGRWVSLEFLWGIGETDYLISLDEGRVTGVRIRTLPIETGTFSIRAASEVWTEHWRALPARDYHDLFSMLSAGLASLDGDITPLMQNLIYFKDLLAVPRPTSDEAL